MCGVGGAKTFQHISGSQSVTSLSRNVQRHKTDSRLEVSTAALPSPDDGYKPHFADTTPYVVVSLYTIHSEGGHWLFIKPSTYHTCIPLSTIVEEQFVNWSRAVVVAVTNAELMSVME